MRAIEIESGLWSYGIEEAVEPADPRNTTGPITSMIWPIDGTWNDSCGFLCGCASHGGNHKGKDMGTFGETPPVIAAADGYVIALELDWNNGNGNTIVIDHGHGIVTRYSHLSAMVVEVDQIVHAGQHIGNAGSTGASEGNHLHFEVLVEGVHVDPMGYLILPAHEHHS